MKYSESFIKEYLQKFNVILLDHYIGYKIPFTLKCLSCDNVWVVYFRKTRNYNCQKCVNKKTGISLRHSNEYVFTFSKGKQLTPLESYTNALTYFKVRCDVCLFEWKTRFNRIQQGSGCPKCARQKVKNTCLDKYGVDNPSKVFDFALKAARSMKNSYTLYHWLTKEVIICQGSYEKKVVEYLNQNKIKYQWQSKIFTLPDGKTYRPDLYLIDEDKWIEIKGWIDRNSDTKEKWHWFVGENPTAELWDKKKLKEMKIL